MSRPRNTTPTKPATEPKEILNSEVSNNDLQMQADADKAVANGDTPNESDVANVENVSASNDNPGENFADPIENELDKKLEKELEKKGLGSDDEEENEDDAEEVELHELHLKLKKKHPRDAFRIGSIVVNNYGNFSKYQLTTDEVRELLTAGPQAHVAVKENVEKIKEELAAQDKYTAKKKV